MFCICIVFWLLKYGYRILVLCKVKLIEECGLLSGLIGMFNCCLIILSCILGRFCFWCNLLNIIVFFCYMVSFNFWWCILEVVYFYSKSCDIILVVCDGFVGILNLGLVIWIEMLSGNLIMFWVERMWRM